MAGVITLQNGRAEWREEKKKKKKRNEHAL